MMYNLLIVLGYSYTGCVCFVWSQIALPAILDIIMPKNETRPKALCHYAEYLIDQQEYLYYLALQTFVCVEKRDSTPEESK